MKTKGLFILIPVAVLFSAGVAFAENDCPIINGTFVTRGQEHTLRIRTVAQGEETNYSVTLPLSDDPQRERPVKIAGRLFSFSRCEKTNPETLHSDPAGVKTLVVHHQGSMHYFVSPFEGGLAYTRVGLTEVARLSLRRSDESIAGSKRKLELVDLTVSMLPGPETRAETPEKKSHIEPVVFPRVEVKEATWMPAEIKKMRNGLFARENIKKGQTIGFYLGKIHLDPNAVNAAIALEDGTKNPKFAFYNSAPPSNEGKADFVIDGFDGEPPAHERSPMTYANHSLTPNATYARLPYRSSLQEAGYSSLDGEGIAVVATEDIPLGVEILVSYGDTEDSYGEELAQKYGDLGRNIRRKGTNEIITEQISENSKTLSKNLVEQGNRRINTDPNRAIELFRQALTHIKVANRYDKARYSVGWIGPKGSAYRGIGQCYETKASQEESSLEDRLANLKEAEKALDKALQIFDGKKGSKEAKEIRHRVLKKLKDLGQ
jgi:hypothetical protein